MGSSKAARTGKPEPQSSIQGPRPESKQIYGYRLPVRPSTKGPNYVCEKFNLIKLHKQSPYMVPDVRSSWSNAINENGAFVIKWRSDDGRRFVLFATMAQTYLWRNENPVFEKRLGGSEVGKDYITEIYGDAFIFAIKDPNARKNDTGDIIDKWSHRATGATVGVTAVEWENVKSNDIIGKNDFELQNLISDAVSGFPKTKI